MNWHRKDHDYWVAGPLTLTLGIDEAIVERLAVRSDESFCIPAQTWYAISLTDS